MRSAAYPNIAASELITAITILGRTRTRGSCPRYACLRRSTDFRHVRDEDRDHRHDAHRVPADQTRADHHQLGDAVDKGVQRDGSARSDAAADRLHGGVYVISVLDQASLHRALSTEDDEVPGADDVRVQNKKFEDMTVRGITVRGHASFHAKFLVVDDRVALVSSANLETPALADRPTRGATGENGFVVSDVDELLRLSRFFTRLWQGCTYHMPTGRDHTVQEREATPVPCRVPVAGLGHDPAVVWTHDEEHGILDTVHHVIAHARRSLLLASFSLNGLTDHPELLLDPLDRAARTHRPRMELLVRARNNHTRTRRGAAALAELGVVVHADSLTHAKATIADDEYGALFSANFDAEVGVRLRAGPSLREATRHLRHAVAHADLTFAPNPTQRELDERLGAWWRTAWPF
jgi:phosphatidylserine/phosphatidylglycerophosphate/cardiolipin synthase-like enzyme